MCANASPIDSRAIAMAWRAVLDLATQPPTVAEREGSTQMEVGVGGSRPLTRNYVANVLPCNADIFGKTGYVVRLKGLGTPRPALRQRKQMQLQA